MSDKLIPSLATLPLLFSAGTLGQRHTGIPNPPKFQRDTFLGSMQNPGQ
jgi:hypothetical protein